jgi:hypothetical protein
MKDRLTALPSWATNSLDWNRATLKRLERLNEPQVTWATEVTLGGLDELNYKPAASLGCMIARPDLQCFLLFASFPEAKAGN